MLGKQLVSGAVAAAILAGLPAAAAAPASSVRVPAGARVSVTGSTVALRSNGTSGTYSCSCGSVQGGSCAIKQSPGVVQCVSDTKNPCSACQMETTTNPKGTGIAAGARATANGAARTNSP